MLFLSALGFSAGLLVARIWGDVDSVSHTLNYQSSLSLFAFILQIGFRASLRKLLYQSKTRIVLVCELYLVCILTVFSILVFFIELFDEVYLLVSSCALAVITLKLTLSVAREEKIKQFFFTCLNFLLCASGGVLFFIWNDPSKVGITLELISLTFLFCFTAFGYRRKYFKYKYIGIFKKVFTVSQSYQLGSAFIFFLVYILTQYTIKKYTSIEEIGFFADIQIVSGAIALTIGQLLLVFEKVLYLDRNARTKIYFVLFLIQVLLISVMLPVSIKLYDIGFYFSFVVIFVFTVRPLLGYVVQYSIFARKIMNCIVFVFICFYLFLLYVFPDYLSVMYIVLPAFILVFFGFLSFSCERYYDK